MSRGGERITFRAYGVPRPQGSLRLVSANRGRGRPYLANPDTLIVWRNALVHEAASAAAALGWETVPKGIPVRLYATFTYDRPKSHTKRQQAADGGRKANGSDLDKLVRAVGDALTIAELIEDDAQITDLKASKRYVGTKWALDRPGAEITVEVAEGKSVVVDPSRS